MDKSITSAKGKTWGEMNNEERIAFVEAVCMFGTDRMKACSLSRNTKHTFKFIGQYVIGTKMSESPYMNAYVYSTKAGSPLAIECSDGQLIDLSNDMREIKIFVTNAIKEVPMESPIMNRVLSGKKKFEIISEALTEKQYKHLEKPKGRKPQKDSLRQRILRGEITRYEAYDKPKRLLDIKEE